MSEWKIQGSRVYGKGYSYNLTNKIDATKLQQTLNNYETTLDNIQTTSQKLHNIEKQLVHIQMSLSILTEDINKLKEVMTQ